MMNLDGLRFAELGSADGQRCPRCPGSHGLALLEVVLGDGAMEVAYCAACRGLLLQPGKLEEFLLTADSVAMVGELPALGTIEARIAATPRAEEESGRHYIGCPACKVVMTRKLFGRESGVMIDWCRDHGVWLDGGELRAITEWWHAGGKAKSKAPGERPLTTMAVVGSAESNWSDYDALEGIFPEDGWAVVKGIAQFLSTPVHPTYFP